MMNASQKQGSEGVHRSQQRTFIIDRIMAQDEEKGRMLVLSITQTTHKCRQIREIWNRMAPVDKEMVTRLATQELLNPPKHSHSELLLT